MPGVADEVMPRNLEIKARIESIQCLLPPVQEVAESGPIHIEQDDTFFNSPTGRLKLRCFPDGTGELIS